MAIQRNSAKAARKLGRPAPKEGWVPPGRGEIPRMVRWTTQQMVEVQRQILISAGQDPAQVPDVPFRFVTLKEFCAGLGLSVSTVYRGITAGKIPRPVNFERMTNRSTSP